MRNEKRVSHPKNTTVHKHLDARSYKGCIVTSSSLVLTAKGIGALTSFFSIERKHGVAESNWIRFSCGETLVDENAKVIGYQLYPLLSRSRYEG